MRRTLFAAGFFLIVGLARAVAPAAAATERRPGAGPDPVLRAKTAGAVAR
jgi:hypothetical protein